MKRLQTYIHVAQAWIYQHGEWWVIFSSFHTDRIGNSKWGMHSFSQHLLRYKKRTTMDMHHFGVVFLRICTARNKYFLRATTLLSSVHFNTLSTCSWSEMLYTRFWCFRTRSSQREHALHLQLYQGKMHMGTHDLPLKVSNEACAHWTGTSQV